MRNAVLLSIRPEWCELIASGKKTIEVRKTKPNLPTPFKCYIYETQGRYRAGNEAYNFLVDGSGRRKVIGEFICDAIWMLAPICHAPEDIDVEHMSQLSREQIVDYLCGEGYGWHISDLVIYDKPKELGEFIKPGARDIQDMDEDLCTFCMETDYGDKRNYSSPSGWCSCEGMFCERAYSRYLDDEGFRLTRPPQSWQYVEVL